MDFNVFYGNTEYYLKDEPFKIISIIVDDKIGILAHKDVLRYMIKIIKYSKEDLKDFFY